jgi:hypothetical protein
MLDLNDRLWAELMHAYGPAADISPLLRQLAESPQPRGPEEEPWFTLWSSLCHQGDVYTASYAAIPHIVGTARAANGPIDFSFFLLPASVEVARAAGRGPEMPDFLADAYHAAIQSLPDCISAHHAETWSADMTIAAAAALAVSKGHNAFAEAVMNLDPDLIKKINAGAWE